MKTQFKNLVLLLCMVIFSNHMVKAQPYDKKHDKKEHRNNGKDKDKNDKNRREEEKDDYKHDDKHDEKHNDRYKENMNRKDDIELESKSNVYLWNGYIWDSNSFKNRTKIKNQEMVTVCHKFSKDGEPNATIRVSAHAAKAHLRHGDVMGECPAIAKNKYSSLYIKQRNNYYNTMENSSEQVAYSKSILDYALARLAQSQLELAILQKQRDRQAEVARKQAAVIQLEQNTSLLQTMIGVTANLLVNKM